MLVQCPHCGGNIVIESINCGIFRHGVFKATMEQIPPHSTLEECNKFISEGTIFGCGKPFQILQLGEGNFIVQDCDYL